MNTALQRKTLPPLLMALIASAGLLINCAASSAATQEANGPKPKMQQEGGPLLFDPAHQKPITFEDKEISIQLQMKNWNLAEGWKLGLTVRSKGSAAHYIPLPHEIAQVNEIRRVSSRKAFIVGMLNGDAWAFAVLDLGRYQIVDTVWCYDPVVSPDGTYIAFIKFFPTHFAYEVEDHYMIYDLKLSAAQNRSSKSYGVSDKINVGLPAYPPHMQNAPGDNTSVPQERAHFIASQGFFWRPDSGGYAFADRYQGRLSLISVQMANNPGSVGASVSSLEVPTEQICGAIHKQTCELVVADVQFDPQGVTATFRGHGADAALHVTLTFPYSDFRRVQ